MRQLLSSRGMAVLVLNYRGSTGYGMRYAALANGNLRVYIYIHVCVHTHTHTHTHCIYVYVYTCTIYIYHSGSNDRELVLREDELREQLAPSYLRRYLLYLVAPSRDFIQGLTLSY